MQHLLLAPLLAGLLTAAAAAPPPRQWQPAWISSPQPAWGSEGVLPTGLPARLDNVTLRQVVRTSVAGEALRLVVDNAYGPQPLEIGSVTLRRAGGATAVRFGGREGLVVAPGARVVSDAVAHPVAAGERLVVDLHLPGPTALAGFHWDAREQTLLLRGRGPEVLQASTGRAFLTELQVASTRPPASVVALGDSITDGVGATLGADQRWPDHLARRLAPHGVAVLNAGIAGNRLLRAGWGESALARFEHDVLRHPGVRAVIVLLGTNDIGFPGSPFAPAEPPQTLAALQQGLRQLVGQAHARGVRVVGATVPPFERALEGTPLEGHHSTAKEALRQALNAWMRSAGAFDAVVDFDAVLRDPARPARLLPALDSGDHLHPGDAGYRRMAEAVDLAALLGDAVPEAAR